MPVPDRSICFYLNRDSSTNVIADLALTLVGGRRQAGADDVKQGLANFSGTRTNYLTLFIFKNVNSASRIEGKNHRPRIHCNIVSRVRSLELKLLRLAVFQPATKRARGSNQSAAQKQQACRLGNLTTWLVESTQPPLVDFRERGVA
jgi:hypothetical protein